MSAYSIKIRAEVMKDEPLIDIIDWLATEIENHKASEKALTDLVIKYKEEFNKTLSLLENIGDES
jgi:hypothetical protein